MRFSTPFYDIDKIDQMIPRASLLQTSVLSYCTGKSTRWDPREYSLKDPVDTWSSSEKFVSLVEIFIYDHDSKTHIDLTLGENSCLLQSTSTVDWRNSVVNVRSHTKTFVLRPSAHPSFSMTHARKHPTQGVLRSNQSG